MRRTADFPTGFSARIDAAANPRSSPVMSSPPEMLRPVSWFSLLIGAWLSGRAVLRLSQGQSSAWILGIGAVGAWFLGRELYQWWRIRSSPPGASLVPDDAPDASPDPAETEDPPVRSLVFLLESPREISGDLWIRHLGESLGIDLLSKEKDATSFVMPMPHPELTPQGDDCYMLKIPEGVFWIFHVKRPYVDDPAAWAAKVSDQRLREAFAAHQAWISVDLLTWLDGKPDPVRIYGMIGKILAALAGPDVLVLYSPELGRANEFDPILLPRLTGGDPLALFEDPTFAPVLHARTDDEQMEAAVAEARRRWPEFAALFESRDPASERPFIVKAPFTSGDNTEHMWVVVTAIRGDAIRGTLANHPHHLLDYHEGQEVTVDAATLTDWLCADANDAPLGGWTQKVLNAQNRRSKESGG
jgi:uncharacterized protein YegJ (DUF2314 family)